MWKLAAAVMLVWAGAAQGAVSLYLTTTTGETSMPAPAVDTPFTLKVMLDVGAAEPVTGVSFTVATNNAGRIGFLDREIMHPVLTDPHWWWDPITIPHLLNPKFARDLGVGSSDGVTPTTPGLQQLMTLTFRFEGAQPLSYPVTLSIVGVGTWEQGVWADPDFNTWNLPITTFTLTPEPGSMVLLAGGVGLFARRRRR